MSNPETKFEFNFDAMPISVSAADVGNALVALIVALDPSITSKTYNDIPDNFKAYWMAVEQPADKEK